MDLKPALIGCAISCHTRCVFRAINLSCWLEEVAVEFSSSFVVSDCKKVNYPACVLARCGSRNCGGTLSFATYSKQDPDSIQTPFHDIHTSALRIHPGEGDVSGSNAH